MVREADACKLLQKRNLNQAGEEVHQEGLAGKGNPPPRLLVGCSHYGGQYGLFLNN